MSADILHVTDDNFDAEVLSSDLPVLVDFWAEWCGPCKMIAPILEEIANEKSEDVGIYKVNVDENTDLAQEHGVQSIPTLLLYKNGSLAETIVGLKTKDELIQLLES